MIKKSIVFFSTNDIWGGSEILWAQSAKKLQGENFNVKAVAKYDFDFLKSILKDQSAFLNISENFIALPLWKRAFNKMRMGNFAPGDKIRDFIISSKPMLAIISQGNNTEGYDFMELCSTNGIPFITLTHLVAESKWPEMNDERIEKFRLLYDKAKANFFVSKHTLRMHQKFIGYPCANAKIIYNPFTKYVDDKNTYPGLIDGNYKVALLGRLENYHKGYDLLIDVLSYDKWKQRNIQFTIYGTGPHLQLISRLTGINKIENLVIKEHIENIAEVWKENHLLLMPSRLEGQSLTLIEAMNFKRAAVVTQVGGVEELIEEGKSGFIAEFPAAKAIDDALERAWNNRTEWEQMGINAYHSIKEKHPFDAVAYFNTQLMPFLKE